LEPRPAGRPPQGASPVDARSPSWERELRELKWELQACQIRLEPATSCRDVSTANGKKNDGDRNREDDRCEFRRLRTRLRGRRARREREQTCGGGRRLRAPVARTWGVPSAKRPLAWNSPPGRSLVVSGCSRNRRALRCRAVACRDAAPSAAAKFASLNRARSACRPCAPASLLPDVARVNCVRCNRPSGNDDEPTGEYARAVAMASRRCVWAVDYAEPAATDRRPLRGLVSAVTGERQAIAWLPVPEATAEQAAAALESLFREHVRRWCSRATTARRSRAEQSVALLREWQVVPWFRRRIRPL